MSNPRISSETLHASCVAIGEQAVLLAGRSGTGKSDLALRLIDRGHRLISDDYVLVRRIGTSLLASPPATIEGKIEARNVGILDFPFVRDLPVALFVDLEQAPVRLPDGERRVIAGVSIPIVALSALEPSAPIKVEAALKLFG